MQKKNIAILLFDDVEVLDFAGPFEVFSVTGTRSGAEPFNVYTVAETKRPIDARNQLSINPRYGFDDCPAPDILLVPGGKGTRVEMENAKLIDWIRRMSYSAELTLSVCTGSLLLAKAGLLHGLAATTHHGNLDLLQELAPKTTIERSRRYVDGGAVITSAGVAAGIDMSFYVLSRLLGSDVARETANYIEYPWSGNGTWGAVEARTTRSE